MRYPFLCAKAYSSQAMTQINETINLRAGGHDFPGLSTTFSLLSTLMVN